MLSRKSAHSRAGCHDITSQRVQKEKKRGPRKNPASTRKRPDADASQRLAGAQFFCNKLLSKTNLVFF